MKRCTLCGDTKPLDEFYKNKGLPDGHGPWCYECKRERDRIQKRERFGFSPKQPAKPKPGPSHKIWVRECIDTGVLFVAKTSARIRCEEAQREYTLKSGRDNYNIIREENVWTFICDECGKEHTVKPEEKRRRFCSDKCQRRYSKRIARAKRKNIIIVEEVSHFKVFRKDKFRCQHCGCKVQKKDLLANNAAELDHIVPVSLGGPHSYSNVQTLCRKCNQEKSNKYEGQLKLAV